MNASKFPEASNFPTIRYLILVQLRLSVIPAGLSFRFPFACAKIEVGAEKRSELRWRTESD